MIVDFAVLVCERLTSVQELEKWVFLKAQEIVKIPEIVDVNVDEITFVEKLPLESPRLDDSIATSHVDALASQCVQIWEANKDHFEYFWDCESLRASRD